MAAQAAAPNAVASFGLALTRAKPSAVGMTNKLIPRLDSVIRAAIADHATPGATIAIARRGRILLLKGYGHTDWAKGAPRATDSTMYDLASLTKVVATTTAAMILEEDGKLDLGRTVASYLPEYDVPDKRTITVRMLVEGTVQRANQRLRVSIRLVSVANDSTVWATTIDGTTNDALTLQDTTVKAVAAAVAASVRR